MKSFKIILCILFFSDICYSQSNDTLCLKKIEKVEITIEKSASSIIKQLNNYWLFYHAPVWGNGFELHIIDLDKMVEYKMNTFKSNKIKKTKLCKSRARQISLIEANGNHCSIELMEDGSEGYLKKYVNATVNYSYYFSGSTPSEIKSISEKMNW